MTTKMGADGITKTEIMSLTHAYSDMVTNFNSLNINLEKLLEQQKSLVESVSNLTKSLDDGLGQKLAARINVPIDSKIREHTECMITRMGITNEENLKEVIGRSVEKNTNTMFFKIIGILTLFSAIISTIFLLINNHYLNKVIEMNILK